MTADEVFAAWAPDASPWRPWVKPVLFPYIAQITEPVPLPPDPSWVRDWVVMREEGGYRDAPRADIAIVVDLPGEDGMRVGLALASHGYRPVPLYTSIPSHDGLVAAWPLVRLLAAGAARVREVPELAPPAFLLDAARGGPSSRPGAPYFDNRAICRDTDFPSATTLATLGIRRAILVGKPAPDVEPILYAWQRAGIALARVDGGRAVPFVARRRRLASFVRGLGAWLRNNRRDDGGFGAFHAGVEQQSSAG